MITLIEKRGEARVDNRTVGIEPGQRAQACAPHTCAPHTALMIAAQHIATQAMQGAQDHHDAYSRAKRALAPLVLNRIAS